MDIIAKLTSKDDKYACAIADKIISESQETDEWYEYFDDFASLLNHPKSLVRNRVLYILAANIQWDDEKRFDLIISDFLSHITDEKPVTARQCIKALAQIGQTKREYIPMILSALGNADLSKYKDTMRPLIEKDISETERILTTPDYAGNNCNLTHNATEHFSKMAPTGYSISAKLEITAAHDSAQKAGIVEIRRIENNSITSVKELVTDVFMKFEAPDYSDEGVKAFFDTAINNQAYMNSLTIYGAYLGELLVGVIATRNEGNHIALFFVAVEYHEQGIGTKLFEIVLKNATNNQLTVNSSPYAKEVYHRLGFEDTDVEQVVTGIRFIPMIYRK